MSMTQQEILKIVDHTLLTQTTDWKEIREICDDAIAYHATSVCIPPSYVKRVREYAGEQIAICTVIGFPNGYQTTEVKEYETKIALQDGADEIDMVINLTDVKNGEFTKVQDEIRRIKEVCDEHILKVIVETCLLTEEEKIKMCQIVTSAGADYIKTSTGFSTAGAAVEDIRLFAAQIGSAVKIKAAGGIASFSDAEEMIRAGADRLGTSRLIKIYKEIF